jgi:signal transduction histidine kinase
MRTIPRESRLLAASTLLLFFLLALLSFFLIAGELRRSRILTEYEADRLSTALAETLRSQDSGDQPVADRRVLGFGLYRFDGFRVYGFGDAPFSLLPSEGRPRFVYDEGGARLSLTRGLGAAGMWGPSASRNGMRSMRKRMEAMGRGPGGFLYLSLDIGDYLRRRRLLVAASCLTPLIIVFLAALFARLIASNTRYRRAAEGRETLARLGESARTLAHEIRNPLGAIRIQTGIMRQRLHGESWPELDAIDEETERLNVLSRRVGDFLRNPEGRPERVELDAFLSELAGRSPYRPHYLPGPKPAFVVFDPELLRSSIENLLRNASESYGLGDGRAADSAAEVGEVELALERDGNGRFAIAVRDRGLGIAAEAADKVFDPFYTDKVRGSGIGLPLARRFVEAAGGSLVLEARKDGGTEARISLPAAEVS